MIALLSRDSLLLFYGRWRTVAKSHGLRVLFAFPGVDIAMNTHLKNVKLILKGQSAQPLDSMSVRGNQIRYFVAGPQQIFMHLIQRHFCIYMKSCMLSLCLL